MKKITLVLATCAAGFLSAQNLQTMVACYPLACDNVVNYANTGSILDGTAHNLVCTTGRQGFPSQAYQFNGTNTSYAELPGTPGLLNAPNICVSGWYKFTSLGSAQYLVFAKNSCIQNHEAYSLAYGGPSSPYLYVIKNGGPNGGISCTGTPPTGNWKTSNVTMPAFVTGKWYHIVFFVGDSKIWLYVDNIFQGQVSSVSNIDYDLALSPITLGGAGTFWNLPFFGEMQDVSFYSSELSASDVNTLYTTQLNCNGQPKPTGISTTSSSEISLQLYPNPSQGKFTLEGNGDLNLNITDISGKQISHQAYKLNDSQTEISLQDAQPGLYFVNVLNEKSEIIETLKLSVTN